MNIEKDLATRVAEKMAFVLAMLVILWPFLLFGRVKINDTDGKLTLTPFSW